MRIRCVSRGHWRIAIAAISAGLSVAVSSAALPGNAAPATSTAGRQDVAQQLMAAYQSPSGMELRRQLAQVYTDPALQLAVTEFIQANGPAGSDMLSAFQLGMLEALLTETADPALIRAEIMGRPLTPQQQAEAQRVKAELDQNRSIQALVAAGNAARNSAELGADVSDVSAADASEFSNVAVPSTASYGGSTAFDTVVRELGVLRNSTAFRRWDAQIDPALNTPGFLGLLRVQGPLTIASFLPLDTLAGLANDHGSAPRNLPNIIGALVELVSALARLAAAIAKKGFISAVAALAAVFRALKKLRKAVCTRPLTGSGPGPGQWCPIDSGAAARAAW